MYDIMKQIIYNIIIMSLDNLGPYIPEENNQEKNQLSEDLQKIIEWKEIVSETWVDKKELLEDMLQEWLIIENISQLNVLKNLLSHNNISYLKNISEMDLDNIWKISIQKVWDVVKVFPMNYSMKIWENGPFGQAFELSQDGTIEKNIDRDFQINTSNVDTVESWMDELNNNLSQIDTQNYFLDPNKNQEDNRETEISEKINDIQEDTINQENSVEDVEIIEDTTPIIENVWDENKPQENIEHNEEIKNKSYEVQKGDTLWQIIREQYGISDYTDIANTLYKIKQFNDTNNFWENKVDFSKPDTLKISQQLLLPDNITVTSPTKWEKTFSLQQ